MENDKLAKMYFITVMEEGNVETEVEYSKRFKAKSLTILLTDNQLFPHPKWSGSTINKVNTSKIPFTTKLFPLTETVSYKTKSSQSRHDRFKHCLFRNQKLQN